MFTPTALRTTSGSPRPRFLPGLPCAKMIALLAILALTVPLAADPGHPPRPEPLPERDAGVNDVRAYLLGLTANPADLDINGDGVIDAADLLPVEATSSVLLSPDGIHFGATSLGVPVVQPVTIANVSAGAITVNVIQITGDTNSSFFRSGSASYNIPVSSTVNFNVTFNPSLAGTSGAWLEIATSDGSGSDRIPLIGIATSISHRVNAQGPVYTDTEGNMWQKDDGLHSGGMGSTPMYTGPIANTLDDALYQFHRYGNMTYNLPVTNGNYQVDLLFAETNGPTKAVGARQFNVLIEGAAAFTNLDVFAEAGGDTALIKTYNTTVTDSSLTIQFVSVVENAFIAAIRVGSAGSSGPAGTVSANPPTVGWGHIDVGFSADNQTVTLTNTGATPITVETLSMQPEGGTGADFSVEINGQTFPGLFTSGITYPVFQTIPVGQARNAVFDFNPTVEGQNSMDVTFTGNFTPVTVPVSATGGQSTGHPYLHVVIQHDPIYIDFDGNGSESVMLRGEGSHTHQPGHNLVNYIWREGMTQLATTVNHTRNFGVGEHTVTLEIRDDNAPQETLSLNSTFDVVGATEIPGVLTRYYPPIVGSVADMLDNIPPKADWGEILDTPYLQNVNGHVNDTPYDHDVMVRMQFLINVATAAMYEFTTVGGEDHRLFVNGSPGGGPVMLGVGQHSVEARFAISSLGDLPAEVLMSVGGGPAGSIPSEIITHDETGLVPVINTGPELGSPLGGNAVTLTGIGFFPAAGLTVNWGGVNLTGASLNITPFRIELLTPAGAEGAFVNVTVTTANGQSDVHLFQYDSAGGSCPVSFTQSTLLNMDEPTCTAWGPDGRLYVGTRKGKVHAFLFDDSYTSILSQSEFTGIASLSNKEILGIAFNPFDPPSPVKIYVAHNHLYAFNNGGCFSSFAPYPGQVSVLTVTGTNSATVTPYITKLPVSNHDHGINGMEFLNDGDLLICSGGNTNAGIPHCSMGGLPESPLTGAILLAETSRGASFNGAIQYYKSGVPDSNPDQRDGHDHTLAPGSHVRVFAPGVRNSFDLAYTISGRIYATDNSPNAGYGAASTGPASQSGDPSLTEDEVILIEDGIYYGHPNRNRGKTDSRQNVYKGPSSPTIAGQYYAPMEMLGYSNNGIDEYRAQTFNGAIRGDLIIQKWNGTTFRLEVSSDGRTVLNTTGLGTNLEGLGLSCGPGGVVFGAKYSTNGGSLKVAKPVDACASGLTVYDIHPWRAPVTGGHPFIIGGVNFGTNPAAVTVKFGGLNGIPATITSVTNTRIKGTIPNAVGLAPEFLIDVAVTVNGVTKLLTEGFQWLFPAGTSPVNDFWIEDQPNMPVPLGEVAAGIIDNIMYVVGEGNPSNGPDSDKTLAYNLLTNQWLPTANFAQRPHGGNHHASEVIGGKWYLFGGLGDGSEGKVQIYDPGTNSWSLGANIPFTSGSGSSAQIDGLVYYAGGIAGGNTFTTNDFARYNRVNNTWTTLPDMPAGRNHAACESDGTKIYVFGGRGPGSGDTNIVANGFNHVFIFNPTTNLWSTAATTLPIGRGGMGTAVYHNGEFFIMGGETETGPGAVSGNVYNRVDIYNPVSNSWRLGTPMPTPRHGIHPVLYQNKIYVAGGGKNKGFAVASDFDIYVP